MSSRSRTTRQGGGPSRLRRFGQWLVRMDPQRRRRAGGVLAWGVVGVLFVVGLVVGMQALEGRVLRQQYGRGRGAAAVRFTRLPAWMPQALAREILADITPPRADLADRALARRVYDRCAANPWVRRVGRVQVRPYESRPGGVVDVTVEFRRPLARVRFGAKYHFVDADGVRLPETQVPQWVVNFQDRSGRLVRQVCYISTAEIPAAWRPAATRIHYVTIDGVARPAPPVGAPWDAEDLAAGLRLVQLVRPKPYYAQVTVIDVRNHAARITRNEPELRMYAQIGRGRATDIRFGRFPAPGGGDYVVGPARKMSYLDEYAAEHAGRIAGVNSYLDLRYDQLHVSIN